MKKRFGFLTIMAVALVAIASPVIGAALAALSLLAWPAIAQRPLNATPRSIFETRRAGLA